MLLPIIERRYSRLVRAIDSAHALGAESEDLLSAELLPLEPSLGSPLERGRPRDRQLAEQLRNGTAVLALGESSTPQRVPADLGQLIVTVSERTGLGETEAADLVVCWANELRVIPASSSIETASKEIEILSYVEEGYRQERWSQLQALWLILATPLLDPQTGISAAVRPMRSAADASQRQTHLRSQWTRTECLLQTRRRLVAEYGLIAHLMARLESGERFFEGERRSLTHCLFTLAYSVQFTAKEAMTLLKLLRQITLSIGSGISGTGADAQITRGPLQGTSLNEAIDVLVLLSLSVRGVLDPTRYHPLENLHVLRTADSLFSANKLLEDETFACRIGKITRRLESAPRGRNET
ncbi:hypothetical protein F1559_003998 [Cyanidiococcus yangmingshanensis]|uniref:Uncharacterized protein n=1 Tax=Cyanidiococcus yangmingshanensis TaxID=2690220 RepID=A0A7J7IFN6_9RHOD|nr:hypothetical protein F1559_003998 [Cyanidiococcus yangmingshanensis]